MSKEYRDLSLSAKALYIHICTQHSYWLKGDLSEPLGQTDERIKGLTGMSGRTITNAKRELITKGWIKVENGRLKEASKYWLVKTDTATPLPAQVHVQKWGYYVNTNKRIGKEKSIQDPDSPRNVAEDMCRMLAEDTEPEPPRPIWYEDSIK